MFIGDMRVSKTDGSQATDLQRASPHLGPGGRPGHPRQSDPGGRGNLHHVRRLLCLPRGREVVEK